MASMSTPLTLPVVPLGQPDTDIVLPGMVVPLDLSQEEVRTAVEAAREAAGTGKPEVVLVPRVHEAEGGQGAVAYGEIGVVGRVEQVGRLAGGDPGALIRALRRVRVPAVTESAEPLLTAEVRELDAVFPEPPPEEAAELVKEYKALATQWLRERGAWQVVDR
ncbi:LON peptidase substrate-binding domain-containing protein, partial [Streptomyces xiaopingdaonensis]|uniref:LON peptidase substrate-binding domain-containing protein n=1 Tax=Streptomyces xiaopingdaonensis TaxID=1565415 RepID=UPI000525669F